MGGIGKGVATLPVLLVGLLITGLVVGLASLNAGLALPAVLVGAMVPPLVGALQSALAIGDADKLVQYPAGAALIGLVLFIPVALGFGVGRLVRDKFESIRRAVFGLAGR